MQCRTHLGLWDASAHWWLLVHQYPQVPFLRAAPKPITVQPTLVLGIARTKMQDFARFAVLSPTGLHEAFSTEIRIVCIDARL